MARYLLVFGLCLFAVRAFAVVLDPEQSKVRLAPQGQTWSDPTGSADFEQAQAADFEPINAPYVNRGLDRRVHWYRAPLEAKTQGRWVLRAGLPRQDNRLFLLDEQGQVRRLRPRPPDEHFLLDLEPGSYRLYLRSANSAWHLVFLELYDVEAFWRQWGEEQFEVALYYGAVAIMIAFNLMLFLGTRDRIYLAYVATLLAFMAYQYVAVDFRAGWLAETPAQYSALAYLSALLVAVSFTRFTELTLRTAELSPRWHRALNGFIGLNLLTAAALFVAPVAAGAVVPLLGALLVVLLIATGVRAHRLGESSAKYYLVAWGSYLAGMTVYMMGVTGLDVLGLEPHQLNRALKIGSVAEITLLALALAARYNALKEQRAEELELAVAQRTEELSDSNQQLAVANGLKDRFFALIAHDLRGPIGAMQFTFGELLKQPQDLTEPILERLRSTVEHLRLLLDNLLEWALAQQGHLKPELVRLDLVHLCAQEAPLWQEQAQAKNLRLRLELPDTCPVQADARMLQTVLRNLIHNAIKFTEPGGSVEVRAQMDADQCRVSVTDSGAGIPKERQAQLLASGAHPPQARKGAHPQTGTGLGLVLVRQFVEAQGGELGLESAPGQGSRFWFTLEAAQTKPQEPSPTT